MVLGRPLRAKAQASQSRKQLVLGEPPRTNVEAEAWLGGWRERRQRPWWVRIEMAQWPLGEMTQGALPFTRV